MNQPYTRRDIFLDRVVGRYRLVEKIGAGGMGSVYRAVHTEIADLVVAVKLLAQRCAANDSLRQRFRDEAAICVRLGDRSAHIVQIRDYGIVEDLDLPYYAMEYLQGRSLEDVITARVPLSLEASISLVNQLCEGLKIAHDQGVIHRDLKPSNIYLVPDAHLGERVKILDFGIAKFLRDAAAIAEGPLTQGYMGTPHYSSPEQLAGQDIDLRSDIYALGMILYELFAGTTPFAGQDNTFGCWYRAHTTTPPLPMAQANPQRVIPSEIEAVVLQCLAKDPEARPGSTLEISEQLTRALRRIQTETRRQQDQQVLDTALGLTQVSRWREAIPLLQSITYDSPLYSEAQSLVKIWQLEIEYQRVLEQARILAGSGDIGGLIRAFSTVTTIPATAQVFRQAQTEAQRWAERVLEAAEDLARAEKWSEAIQRAELLTTLPGMTQRVSPLIAQWQKEQQAADLLRKAESLAAGQQWEQAVHQTEIVSAGTLSHARALQRRILWQKEIQSRQVLEQAEGLAAQRKYEEAIACAATVIRDDTAIAQDARTRQADWQQELARHHAQTRLSEATPAPLRSRIGLWVGTGGVVLAGGVAAVAFILLTPLRLPKESSPFSPDRQSSPQNPLQATIQPETLTALIQKAQKALDEKRWGDVLAALQNVKPLPGSPEDQQIRELLKQANQGLTEAKRVKTALGAAKDAIAQKRWADVFPQLKDLQLEAGTPEADQSQQLRTAASEGQLLEAQKLADDQQWEASYRTLQVLLATPNLSNAEEARKLLQNVSDSLGKELLQGATNNGNNGELYSDQVLLRQAIATARKVPPESSSYTPAQQLIQEWEAALKNL
ncbi:serine/threonine-protein kinase [Anthocerotibacter panamensis]|uniref:serine/threonine-protein kinase n=1 Tax=Anthocerotibacter panamensis TaxID=2857077 RepID=UPI001C4031FC|nr:serine/threonine-protein kinase [Anthocerotibacter panamensis]